MKTKAEKIAEAKKNAEKEKAARKQVRDAKANTTNTSTASSPGKKGKSVIPQSKTPKKK